MNKKGNGQYLKEIESMKTLNHSPIMMVVFPMITAGCGNPTANENQGSTNTP